MIKLQIQIQGITAMLMNNAAALNPFDETVRQKKQLTAKRKKTDDDLETIAELEWRLSLYFDESLGLYWPSPSIWSCLHDGAKKSRLGRQMPAVVVDHELGVKLTNGDGKGWNSVEKLWGSAEYRNVFRAVRNGKSVQCTRGRVPAPWFASVNFLLDEVLIDEDTFISIVHTAGAQCGTGDNRPSSPKRPGPHGRFELMEVEHVKD